MVKPLLMICSKKVIHRQKSASPVIRNLPRAILERAGPPEGGLYETVSDPGLIAAPAIMTMDPVVTMGSPVPGYPAIMDPTFPVTWAVHVIVAITDFYIEMDSLRQWSGKPADKGKRCNN
jgi:hypothetical protein